MTNPNISSYYGDAFLSNLVYDDNNFKDENGNTIKAGGIIQDKDSSGNVIGEYTIIAISPSTSSDYQAYAFKDSSGKVTIANRGTQFLSLGDIISDGEIALDVVPDQMTDAIAFQKQVVAKMQETDSSFSASSIHQTGHSLGGGIAQMMSVMTGTTATTFNAPIVSHLIDNLKSEYPNDFTNDVSDLTTFKSKITEIVEDDDQVSNITLYGDHLGTVTVVDAVNSSSSLLYQVAGKVSVFLATAELLWETYEGHRMEYLLALSESQLTSDQTTLETAQQSYSSDYDIFVSSLKSTMEDQLQQSTTLGTVTSSFLTSLTQAEATQPVYRRDPLTLDLDGDGIDLISLSNSSTFFDLDNDGLREQVGWVKADDGFLVYDSNNNSSVDNVSELFGYENEDGRDVSAIAEKCAAFLTSERTKATLESSTDFIDLKYLSEISL